MAKKDLVVVTGGDGYIASAVVKRLSRRYRVVALDRPDPQGTRDRPDIVPIDLGDDGSVDNALSTIRQCYGNRIASVIHLAAYYDISGEPNPLYDKIIVRADSSMDYSHSNASSSCSPVPCSSIGQPISAAPAWMRTSRSLLPGPIPNPR